MLLESGAGRLRFPSHCSDPSETGLPQHRFQQVLQLGPGRKCWGRAWLRSPSQPRPRQLPSGAVAAPDPALPPRVVTAQATAQLQVPPHAHAHTNRAACHLRGACSLRAPKSRRQARDTPRSERQVSGASRRLVPGGHSPDTHRQGRLTLGKTGGPRQGSRGDQGPGGLRLVEHVEARNPLKGVWIPSWLEERLSGQGWPLGGATTPVQGATTPVQGTPTGEKPPGHAGVGARPSAPGPRSICCAHPCRVLNPGPSQLWVSGGQALLLSILTRPCPRPAKTPEGNETFGSSLESGVLSACAGTLGGQDAA